MRQGSADGFVPAIASSDAASPQAALPNVGLPDALQSSASETHGATRGANHSNEPSGAQVRDTRRDRENARRAAISVICIVGSTLIFKMVPLLEPVFSVPSTVLYGLTGALFGAILGACQRADELEDRIMHASIGAIILAIVFVLFSLGGPHPRFGRFS